MSKAAGETSPAAETARGRAVVLSGKGRFADAWHPFPETSSCLAALLQAEGFDVEISGVDERMADLSDVQLLVVNIGAPSAPDRQRDAQGRCGLLRYFRRGGPALVMHVSSTSLPAVPEWASILGGIWVRGTTMHPPYGLSRVHVQPEPHPITATVRDFELYDERYSYLDVAGDVVPLATHTHDGVEHPLLWARTYQPAEMEAAPLGRPAGARVVYDALGHDGRSYESPEHREIITRAVRWLAADLDQG